MTETTQTDTPRNTVERDINPLFVFPFNHFRTLVAVFLDIVNANNCSSSKRFYFSLHWLIKQNLSSHILNRATENYNILLILTILYCFNMRNIIFVALPMPSCRVCLSVCLSLCPSVCRVFCQNEYSCLQNFFTIG